MLTQQDLDLAICSMRECTYDHSELVLHGKCHPKSPTWAAYSKADGVLRIGCAECGHLVVEILVARGS